MSFWGELRRRNVIKVGVAYAALSWLLIQVTSIVLPTFRAPDWVNPTITFVLILGLPIAVLMAWAYEVTPQGVKKTRHVPLEQSITHVTGQRLNYIVTALLALAVIFLVFDSYISPDDSVEAIASAQDQLESPGNVPSEGAASIAVLPFVNLSSDAEQEYFADGLTEELLNSLTRIEGLQVAGRTSSFKFKDKNEDLRVIGEMLGVENLLEGSVRRSNDEIRITAQLIHAGSGYHLWSETYDRQFDDIFAVQDEIATAVASALEVTLGLSEFGRLPGMTRDVGAYNEYLLGSSADWFSPERFRDAIDHLEAAVTLDPEFAVAWMKLSDRYSEGAFTFPEVFRDAADRSRLAFERARSLAPDSYLVLRRLHFDAAERGAWPQADRLIDQAFEAAAEYSLERQVAFDRNMFLLATGRAAEAVQGLQYLRTIDPLDAQVSLFLAESLSMIEDFESSLAEFDRGSTLEDADLAYVQGSARWAALASGDSSEIEQRMAVPASGVNLIAQEHLNNSEAALAELRQLYETSELSGFEQHLVADWASYFGDQALAIDAKTRAFETGSAIGLAFTLWRPLYRDLRQTEGFKDLVRRIGLVDYWRETGAWGDFCDPLGSEDFACR
jgi:TolB-like protein